MLDIILLNCWKSLYHTFSPFPVMQSWLESKDEYRPLSLALPDFNRLQ